MKHVLNILVNNHPGVMSHVSGLFTRRGYNIDSIAVGATEDPEFSSMTIVMKGDDAVIGLVKKQLLKLPDVLKVEDLAYLDSITRELILVRVKCTVESRNDLLSIVDAFNAKIAEMTEASILLEFSGESRKVASLIEIVRQYGIIDIARTGQVALRYSK